MPRCAAPLCRRCGAELRGAFDAVLDCAACRTRPRAFDVARAPWRYAGPARHAIHRFKYRRRWRLGAWLADDMARTARAALPPGGVSAVVPVPLHWLKRRLAGRNHAEELAHHLARALGTPCLPQALTRRRWTRPQTRLSGRSRLANVRRAFAASEPLVRGRTVLLVDDVLTSGATADACARVLKAAGARAVYVLTAARTPLE
jgi:ComF family protein